MNENRLNPARSFLLVALVLTVVFWTPASGTGDLKKTSFSIESVFCSACVDDLQSAVEEIEGVVSADVFLEEHRLDIVFDPAVTNTTDLAATIKDKTTFELRLISEELLGNVE